MQDVQQQQLGQVAWGQVMPWGSGTGLGFWAGRFTGHRGVSGHGLGGAGLLYAWSFENQCIGAGVLRMNCGRVPHTCHSASSLPPLIAPPHSPR